MPTCEVYLQCYTITAWRTALFTLTNQGSAPCPAVHLVASELSITSRYVARLQGEKVKLFSKAQQKGVEADVFFVF